MSATAHQTCFGSRSRKWIERAEFRIGFTLIELLVVVGILSILMAILIPVLGNVRQQARRIIGIGNMRQIVSAVNCYADDNKGQYPPSVATLGVGTHWNWQEPTYLTAYRSEVHDPPVRQRVPAPLRRQRGRHVLPGAPRSSTGTSSRHGTRATSGTTRTSPPCPRPFWAPIASTGITRVISERTRASSAAREVP